MRGTGSLPNLLLKSVERLGFAFRHDLDATIGEISHPTVRTLASGSGARKKPEPDSLNAADDQVVPPKAHEETRRLYPALQSRPHGDRDIIGRAS